MSGIKGHLNNDKGFTLLEMIIVIFLIALSLSMVTISWRLIFTNNVKSYAEQFNSDLRRMKNDTMTSQGDEYFLLWKYDSTDDLYYYEIYREDAPSVLIKSVKLSSSIDVQLDKSGTYQNLETYSADDLRIEFDPASGKLVNVSDTNGGGVYLFTTDASDTQATVSVIEETGRVFYDD